MAKAKRKLVVEIEIDRDSVGLEYVSKVMVDGVPAELIEGQTFRVGVLNFESLNQSVPSGDFGEVYVQTICF